MNENVKTILFVAVAAGLAGLAVITTPSAARFDPERFSDQGQEFFPDFKDPSKAASLEVIAYDDQTGTTTPFKVQNKSGVWTIPSHFDYPADGKDRLANTASSIIDLKKDTVISDRIEDHEALGLIDPLDEETATLKGRGQRITLRDESGTILSDYIVGAKVADKEGFHYLRLPGKNRSYASKAEIDLSTKFADWIETNLLNLTATDVTRLDINAYSVDESTGRVDVKDSFELLKGSENKWSVPGLAENQEVDQTVARRIPSSLAGIRITGVRPKPESLTQDLRVGSVKLDLETQLSLNSKGFFVSSDGRLLSNEGEIEVGLQNGVSYTLRFGEVVFGEGLDISAGAEDQPAEKTADKSGPENRYLFVTAAFDADRLPPKPQPPAAGPPPNPAEPAGDGSGQAEPPHSDDAQSAAFDAEDALEVQEPGEEPAGDAAGDAGDEVQGAGDEVQEQKTEPPSEPTEDAKKKAEDEARRATEEYEGKLKEWEQKAEDGRKAAAKLNERFAPWYYVISGQDFSKIMVQRSELIKEKKTEKKE
jgi:hypothetical protein